MDTQPRLSARSVQAPAAATGWWARLRQALQSPRPATPDDAADHGTAFGLDLSFSQRRDPGTPPER